MKRILCFMLTICMFAGCSCNTKTATTFNSKAISNSYNNYLAGGKIAYIDNNLYVTYISNDYKNLGTYKFNNNGVSRVMADVSEVGSYSAEAPCFYQLDEELYVFADGVFAYDGTNDKLTECQYDDIPAYFTDDLKAGWKDGNLTITYKDNPDFVIEEAHEYYVDDYKIYFSNTDGWLYCIDVTKGTEPEFLSYLSESPLKFLHMYNDNIYFNCDSDYNDKFKTGLYCYNVVDEKIKLILEGNISCLNSYDGVLYIASDSGVFKCTENEVNEITNRSAKEIYLLDEDWIYAVENDAGNVYRVSRDGETVEIINYLNS